MGSDTTVSTEWSIILVEPARGGNIGAAARAMKTMGFSDLRIVDPDDSAPLESEEAVAFAHGSGDVLRNAKRYRTLGKAIHDCATVIGTTARHRGKRSELFTPEELVGIVRNGAPVERIGVVFGPEERGLTNRELALCDIATAIPMRGPYPSLNLGQAVMVYTYALSPLLFETHRRTETVPESESVSAMHRKAQVLLPRLGFDPGRAIFTRILERMTTASETDLRLIHSVLNAIEIHIPGDAPSTEGLDPTKSMRE